ncbi:hypothetical protein [Streptacidiphilus sp. EB129]|uniref:hypothetical protein n=1 Tax=Streptacidiphilus sp. EB129 TaxID=3156262 RepID=UPI003513DD7B
MSQLLASELVRLGHPQPAHAADQLLLLIDGVMAAGATRPNTNPAGSARELAEQIVAQHRSQVTPVGPTQLSP